MCMYKVLIIEDEVWISALIRSILEEGVPSVQVVERLPTARRRWT